MGVLTQSRLPAGTRLGAYEILGLLGAGGMGEVYLARDTRLGRDIALKLLPAGLATDADRLARFEREARALAALNHPAVVTVHSVEQADGRRFLTMERLHGRTLADVIRDTPLPIARILEIAIPVADALAAAHEKGIVHRDLKPGNVMITDEQRVKVLDFGLAKIVDGGSANADLSTEAATAPAQMLGTIPYMSPEQLRGDAVDARSDVFAFAVLLYEMASGTRPFRGSSAVDVVSAIVKDEPQPLDTLRGDLPPAFVRLVARCLDKDPRRRTQSAVDLRHELEDVAGELRRSATQAPTPARLRRLTAAAVVLAAAVLSGMWIAQRFGSTPAGGPIGSLAVLPFTNLMHDASQDYFVDGMHEAVITDLARLGIARVTPRKSVLGYKRHTTSLREVAADLGVDALVEGSILRAGNRVRIDATLVRAGTEEHLWADSYEGDLEDVLSLLGRVSHAIAVEVHRRVAVDVERPQLAERITRPRIRPDAFEAYLRGQHVISGASTPYDADAALVHFERAVEHDPAFAQAWAGVATVTLVRAMFATPTAYDLVPRARDAAQKALALDKDEGGALAVLGAIDLFFDANFSEARRKLEHAVALRPHDALLRHVYGDYLMATGRSDESLEQVRLGRSYDPMSTLAQRTVLYHTMATRRYDDVIAEGRRTLKDFPALATLAHSMIGDALWRQGKYEESLNEQRLGFGSDVEAWRVFEAAYRRAGPNAALKAIAELTAARADSSVISPIILAGMFAEGGDADAAMRWLERGYQTRRPLLLHVPGYPAFDPIRNDPRFIAFLRRVGVPVNARGPSR